MDFDKYQDLAQQTDRVPSGDGRVALIVPLLGLAGETGQLLSEYKKQLRDGEAHRMFAVHVSEELSDLLWYISNVASKFDLSLSDIAAANLVKVKERWKNERIDPLDFDDGYPEEESLPRRFDVELVEMKEEEHQVVKIRELYT